MFNKINMTNYFCLLYQKSQTRFPKEVEIPSAIKQSSERFLSGLQSRSEIISIFHGCIVWIEKSVTRVTDRHHKACRVIPNSDPE